MPGCLPCVAGARAIRRAPAASLPRTGFRRLGDRGAVTAETAMVLPLLVAATLGLVWMLSLAVAQVRVTDAAREVARALARDEARASAFALGRRVAPAGARIGVRQDGRVLLVHVEAVVGGADGLFRFVPSVSVDAEAVTAQEGR